MHSSLPKPNWTLTFVIVYVSYISLFTIGTIQLRSVKVLKSWKIPTEKWRRYRGMNPGLQLPILSLVHILLNSFDTDMKLEIGSSRGGGGVKALSLEVPCWGSCCRCQTYPISTAPVERITAQATVPSLLCHMYHFAKLPYFNINIKFFTLCHALLCSAMLCHVLPCFAYLCLSLQNFAKFILK
jgi:hypothetical protein